MSHKPYIEGAIPHLSIMTGHASNSEGVVLNHSLTASRARISPEVKRILTGVVRQAIVKVHHDYYYLVDFGPGVRPQLHIVSHDIYCACELGSDCSAVTAVKVYLQRGMGEPAKMPRPGYFPACPHVCPICGARAFYDPGLSSHHRGIGWQCSKHGASHYWQHQGSLPRPA